MNAKCRTSYVYLSKMWLESHKMCLSLFYVYILVSIVITERCSATALQLQGVHKMEVAGEGMIPYFLLIDFSVKGW